jgi:type II secretory pathway component GspD/PulD (secretin)
MKTLTGTIVGWLCVSRLLMTAVAQTAETTAPEPPAAVTNTAAPSSPAVAAMPDPGPPEPAVVPPSAGAPGEMTPSPTNGAGGIRLNFRGAPLDLVLNHLSDAAGFIIVLETEVKGKVDMWSNHPVTADEAVDLLNAALNRNGYAALRNGRTLTIVSRDDAKKRNIPVKSGNNPTAIPQNDEIVTQIIPVRFISATPLARDLQPLLPSQATLTANEGGNALVITDTQTNIRRMAEIVRALDTAISSVSAVRVFPLQYADAKALATVISQLFQPQQDAARMAQGQAAAGRFFNIMRGGDPGGARQGSTDLTGGRAPTPRVTAVADERSNAVVVSAPEEQMPIVEDLIQRVDINVEDVTELRVFHLRYADPQETADLLTSLFPDPTSGSSQGSRGQVQFGGGRFGGPFGGAMGRGNTAAGDQSTRLQKQSRVLAVPDLRTGSVVVSAARELMEQIGNMIEVLDADPAKKQKVHVFSVENTDPQAVQEILQNLFPDQNYGTGTGRRTTQQSQTGSQLNNRSTRSQNNQRLGTGSGFGGNTGFGTGSGFGTTGTGR